MSHSTHLGRYKATVRARRAPLPTFARRPISAPAPTMDELSAACTEAFRALCATVRGTEAGQQALEAYKRALAAYDAMKGSTRQPAPVRSEIRHLSFHAWLEATGETLAGKSRIERQEVCRRFECYRRGALYQTDAERNAAPILITTGARVA